MRVTVVRVLVKNTLQTEEQVISLWRWQQTQHEQHRQQVNHIYMHSFIHSLIHSCINEWSLVCTFIHVHTRDAPIHFFQFKSKILNVIFANIDIKQISELFFLDSSSHYCYCYYFSSGPWTRWRDFISHLTWECLGIFQEELEYSD